MVPECVAEELPEQQSGEGKCPLTIMSYILYNSPSRITLLKPKGLTSLYLPYPCLPFGLSWLAYAIALT